MGNSQRTKGAEYEREIVQIFRQSGYECSRNLSQTRDGGGDIIIEDLLIECKRRKSIAVYDWIDQAERAAGNRKPIVIARGDQKHNIVILNLIDFLDMLRKYHGKKD
jgi:Holliday junction resolvase